MTVSVLRNQVQYTGNNSTTAFTVSYPYTEKSQIKVYLDGSLQTITTHYTLTDPDSTGTVTFGTAPGTGVVITILRETDFLQTVDYANNDILDAEVLESAFDKLTMMCQQVKNLVDKSVGFDETVSEAETTSLKLAAGTGDLAGKLLAFDDSGNFVTTQEIGTFRGNYDAYAAYVVRDLVRDATNDNVYFTKLDAPVGTALTNTTYFELLVDVETVRTLKVAAETAKTGAETAETNAEAALASFQGQYKSSTSDPYGGSADAGDLWYDETNSILKYYTGSAFEPVTTSLASVTGNYLTISNQVITAGTVPVSLGGTGSTNVSDAQTALGVDPAGTDNSTDVTLATVASNYLTISGQEITAGTVPVSLGGTGSTTDSDARTALGVDPAGTDNSTDVTLVTTSHDYLSISSQAITLGAIDLAADVTGILPVGNGGTGVTALSSLNAADLGSNNGVSDATDGYVLTADGTGGTAWEAATGGGGLSDIVSDTSPQLGGNLDVNGQSIVSVSAGNIAITPDTTGKIILDGLSWPTSDGSADQVLKTDGSGNLSFVDQSGGGGGLSDLEHANSVSTAETISSGQHRFYVGPMTFSNNVTVAGKLLVFDGLYNQTGGTANITGLLKIRS